MKIQPTQDYVLIVQTEAPKKETTIILTPKDTTTGMKPAKVIAKGEEVKELVVKSMVYPIWSEAKPVTIDGTEMALIREKDIMAYVTEL
jgi:co-chaperonin GroES (HSP10)